MILDNQWIDLISALILDIEEYASEKGISIQFGPDVECIIHQDGLNIFHSVRHKSTNVYDKYALVVNLFRDARNLLEAESLITAADSFLVDEDALEINLKPAAPLEAIRSYHRMAEILKSHSNKIGYEIFLGNGHWHFSVTNKEGRDLLRERPYKSYSKFSDLHKRICSYYMGLMESYPAFFIPPHIAEQYANLTIDSDMGKIISEGFNGANYITYSKSDGNAALRTGNNFSSICTIEPRLCAGAPYRPVFFALLSIYHGLSKAEQILGPTQRDSYWYKRKWNAANLDRKDMLCAMPVCIGEQGFQKMIDITRSTILAGENGIGEDIAVPLLQYVSRDYYSHRKTVESCPKARRSALFPCA